MDGSSKSWMNIIFGSVISDMILIWSSSVTPLASLSFACHVNVTENPTIGISISQFGFISEIKYPSVYDLTLNFSIALQIVGVL